MSSLLLGAFNSDSGGSSTKGNDGQPKETPSGVFESTGQLEKDKPTSTNCADRAIRQFDSRIRPGYSQAIEWAQLTTGGKFQGNPRTDYRILAASNCQRHPTHRLRQFNGPLPFSKSRSRRRERFSVEQKRNSKLLKLMAPDKKRSGDFATRASHF